MSTHTIPRSFIPGFTLPQPLPLLLFLNGFLQTLVQPSLTSLLTLSPMAVDLSKLSVVYSLLYVPYLLKPTYARVLIYLESLYSRPLLPFLLPLTYLLQSLSLLLLTTVVDLEGTDGLAWFTTVNWTRELTLAAGDWMLTIAVIRHLRKEVTCTTATINTSMAESSRLRYLGSFLGSLLTIIVYAAIGDDGDTAEPEPEPEAGAEPEAKRQRVSVDEAKQGPKPDEAAAPTTETPTRRTSPRMR